MAALVAFLKAIEYRYMIHQLNIELYLGLVALLFTGLGVWVGLHVIKRKDNPLVNRQTTLLINSENNKLDISDREMDVLLLMSDGLSNQEIADKLFISIHTVKTHSSNLFSKLHVKRRTQAVKKSKEIGLIG